ncbi:MAG: hypothetical protein IPO98_12470 [Saprospiraceae bacterium]|nr:hypothetical protein [Saprospiraceae bacterium]
MCPVTYCPCAGGYIQLKLYFFGENNVKIEVYHDYSLRTKIAEFQNVKSKTLLTLNATNLPNGIFNNEIYLKVTNQSDVSCITRIKTVCPDNLWPGSWEDMEILGKTFKNSYGSFTVYSHKDKVNNYDCKIDEVNTDWHVGGNVVKGDSNKIGTRTYDDLVFITNDSVRLTITKDGELKTGDKKFTIGGNLEVQGDSVIVKKRPVCGWCQSI